ncbi:hypothetical protein GOV11_03475 [Candidatus Woesearchaeota archaeon]|nr:hypothetical protein [Candidatus Woesearchaeota archaeon]
MKGWRNESWRHSLSAKGVKTTNRYMQSRAPISRALFGASDTARRKRAESGVDAAIRVTRSAEIARKVTPSEQKGIDRELTEDFAQGRLRNRIGALAVLEKSLGLEPQDIGIRAAKLKSANETIDEINLIKRNQETGRAKKEIIAEKIRLGKEQGVAVNVNRLPTLTPNEENALKLTPGAIDSMVKTQEEAAASALEFKNLNKASSEVLSEVEEELRFANDPHRKQVLTALVAGVR